MSVITRYTVTEATPGNLPDGDPINCGDLGQARDLAIDRILELWEIHAALELETIVSKTDDYCWFVVTNLPGDPGRYIQIQDRSF